MEENLRKKPVVLCIMDGWGIGKRGYRYNAIEKANTPNYDSFLQKYPNATLEASGRDVGLPRGQMGNSEVGHMNIGAGRVVMQNLPKIDQAIEDGNLRKKEPLQNLIGKLQRSGGICHLLGLLSDGGVHSHIDHIITLAKIVADSGIEVNIHAFLDGRDTPQKSALKYINELQDAITSYNNIKIATIGGRYYGMDRDKRWDRIEKAYDIMMFKNKNIDNDNPASIIGKSYNNDITDEFIEPVAIDDYRGMNSGDAFIIANFRADRVREIASALGDKDFDGFKRKKTVDFVAQVGMTEYSEEINKFLDTLFPAEDIKNCLSEVISEEGLKQLHIAETEKYAHVTFFLNGGREEPFEGEERILVPSPKIATYDLKPEMSASEVTDKLIEAINSDKFDFIVVNYANPDMVGHTGIMEAAIKACEAVDKEIGRLADAVKAKDGLMLIIADHGNVETMFDEESGQPHTAHTVSIVPSILIGNDVSDIRMRDGKLCDVAPTILELMVIMRPEEMTGRSLLTF